MSSTNSISIDDYLQLKDWKFVLRKKEGNCGDFFWLQSEELRQLNVLKTIVPPERPFRALVTYWDCADGAATAYGQQPGWRKIGECAVSNWLTELPKLHFGADCGQMLFETPLDDEELLSALRDFDEPYVIDDPEEAVAVGFWSALAAINPNYYFSYGLSKGFTFIAKGQAAFEHFVDNIFIRDIETIHRDRLASHRASLWKNLGPECGPDVCIEPDCERLRIRLAVRCFIHQIYDHD